MEYAVASDVRAKTEALSASVAQDKTAISGLQSQYLSLGMSYSGLAAIVAALPASRFLAGKYQINGASGVTALPAASVDYLNMYATVVDLFGDKEDNVLCSRVGATYFWQPVRPFYAAKVAVAADGTLYPMRSPSVAILTGTLPSIGLYRTITLSPTLAFPGASFRIKNTMSGLGTLRIGNVNLGTPLSIVLGATQEFVYDMTDGWVQIT